MNRASRWSEIQCDAAQSVEVSPVKAKGIAFTTSVEKRRGLLICHVQIDLMWLYWLILSLLCFHFRWACIISFLRSICGAGHDVSTVHLCSDECPLKEISKGAWRDVNASGMWCRRCLNVIPNIFSSQGSWNACLLFILVHVRAGLVEQDVAAPASVEFKSRNNLLSCNVQDCHGRYNFFSPYFNEHESMNEWIYY